MDIGDQLVRFDNGRTVESGIPSELLDYDYAVTISGRTCSQPRQISDGRVEVELEAATIRAPKTLAQADESGTLTLELRRRKKH